jgi:hypothetical protein
MIPPTDYDAAPKYWLDKMALEDADSWQNYIQQIDNSNTLDGVIHHTRRLRQLKKFNKADQDKDEDGSSETADSHFNSAGSYLYQSLKERQKREKALNEMYRNPGIQDSTMHGMMVRSNTYSLLVLLLLDHPARIFLVRLMLDPQVAECMSMNSIVEFSLGRRKSQRPFRDGNSLIHVRTLDGQRN